jgi:protein-disulfide isomerase
MHKESPLAHEAAAAAADQGKFWEMHDLLFATQGVNRGEGGNGGQARSSATAAESAPVPDFRAALIAKAGQLNLDVPRFTKDLDTHRFKPQVDADRQEGNRLGVDGTPYFFINGHAISGGASLADFKHLIDAALKESTSTPVR